MEVVPIEAGEPVARVQLRIAELLRLRIPQYRTITLSFGPYNVCSIRPLTQYVVQHRLNRAKILIRAMLRQNCAIFDPVLCESGGQVRLIVPPIIERWEGGLFLVDGTHRLYAALNEFGINKVVLGRIMQSHFPPLPCQPSSWGTIQMTPRQLPLSRMLKLVDRQHFRPVSELFNSEELVFDSHNAFDEFLREDQL